MTNSCCTDFSGKGEPKIYTGFIHNLGTHAFNSAMNALRRTTGREGSLRWVRGFALVAAVWGCSALAQVVTVPAAHLNHAEGTVALSPQGDNEWHDVQPRRVLKRGDRLWTDRGSRAEIQAGGHAVRIDSQSQVILE